MKKNIGLVMSIVLVIIGLVLVGIDIVGFVQEYGFWSLLIKDSIWLHLFDGRSIVFGLGGTLCLISGLVVFKVTE